jgi:hypothetical protein
MTRFRRQMRARFAEALLAEGRNPTPRDLDFAAGGVFAVLEAWLLSGCRDAATDLAERLGTQMRRCAPLRE